MFMFKKLYGENPEETNSLSLTPDENVDLPNNDENLNLSSSIEELENFEEQNINYIDSLPEVVDFDTSLSSLPVETAAESSNTFTGFDPFSTTNSSLHPYIHQPIPVSTSSVIGFTPPAETIQYSNFIDMLHSNRVLTTNKSIDNLNILPEVDTFVMKNEAGSFAWNTDTELNQMIRLIELLESLQDEKIDISIYFEDYPFLFQALQHFDSNIETISGAQIGLKGRENGAFFFDENGVLQDQQDNREDEMSKKFKLLQNIYKTMDGQKNNEKEKGEYIEEQTEFIVDRVKLLSYLTELLKIKNKVKKHNKLLDVYKSIYEEIRVSKTSFEKFDKELKNYQEFKQKLVQIYKLTKEIDEMKHKIKYKSSDFEEISENIGEAFQKLLNKTVENVDTQYVEELQRRLKHFSEVNSYYSQLLEKIQKYQLQTCGNETKNKFTCNICVKNEKNAAFQCGHTGCFECLQRMSGKCAVCRKTGQQLIKLFV